MAFALSGYGRLVQMEGQEWPTSLGRQARKEPIPGLRVALGNESGDGINTRLTAKVFSAPGDDSCR